MTRNKRFSLLLVAAAALCAAAVSARAQVTTAPVIKLKPVHTQQAKPAKTRFEVLHMMTTGIQVRSLVNGMEIHTFTYSDQIRDAMQKLLDQGGYHYGDQVEIQYQPGTEIALKIKGKPSRSL
jgi:Spy/CpxP family protein refolding chaperone